MGGNYVLVASLIYIPHIFLLRHGHMAFESIDMPQSVKMYVFQVELVTKLFQDSGPFKDKHTS